MPRISCVAAYPLGPTEAEAFSIGELTREFGVTPRALRFYEEEALIAPRREGTTRIYSRRDRARIAWILRGKRAGFSLDDIGEMLDLFDLDDDRATQRAVTAQRCRDRAEALAKQLDGLEATIEQLSRFADSLERAQEDKAG